MLRFVFHMAGVLVAGATVVSAAQDSGSFDRTLDVSGVVQLEVRTGSGEITVRTGGDGTVEIHGEVRARKSRAEAVRYYTANPPIAQDGNVITIGRTEDEDRRRQVNIDYELVVPANTNLVSKTGSGSQNIADILGALEIASGSGSLDIGEVGDDVSARTGSGSIDIDGVDGDLDVKTGSGDIRVASVTGAISASSGSGNVELAQTGSGDVSVKTGSGRVRVAGVDGGLRAHSGSGDIDVQGQLAREWDLHASSGDVTVNLADASGFELDAETSSGEIDISHPVTTSGTISPKRLRGSVGGGGPRLAVHTSSGSIRIR